MRDWMDFNGDEEIDGAERMFVEEMLCELELMDEDERRETLEDTGLDSDDYDDF